jgi:hypothetical protein
MQMRGFGYTIAGENNPYWVLVEPILLRIWADGIPKASSIDLHVVNGLSLVVSAVGFAFGLLVRAAAVGGFLIVGFLLFPQTIELALGSLFSSLSSVDQMAMSPSWIYRLTGYAIVITSVAFVLGDRLFRFLGEFLLYLLIAVTHVAPLRLLAFGLRKENYVAQAIAKTSFMGMYLVQSVGGLPDESQAEWNRALDLYTRSNTSSGRDQLEKLADDWSRKLVKSSRII